MPRDWMFFVLGAGLVLGVVVVSWRRRLDTAELGTVSHNWLAERRAADRFYGGR